MKAERNLVILSSLDALLINRYKNLVLKRYRFGLATLNTTM